MEANLIPSLAQAIDGKRQFLRQIIMGYSEDQAIVRRRITENIGEILNERKTVVSMRKNHH